MMIAIDVKANQMDRVRAALTLALGNCPPIVENAQLLDPEEGGRHRQTMQDHIVRFCESGAKRKKEIKAFIQSMGFKPSGAGPACFQLVEDRRLIRLSRGSFIALPQLAARDK